MKNHKIVLLLTGTITPNIKTKIVQTDPAARLNEYLKAVVWYLKNTPYKIVFGENSGFSEFKQKIESFGGDKNFNRLEYITYKNENVIGGAGYNEWEILKYVRQKSHFIKDADVIVKCTGRLILTNIKEVLQQVRCHQDTFFIGDYAADFKSMGTTFFVFSPNLFDEIIAVQPKIRENYVEITIMNFVHAQCKKAPDTVLYFNRPLLISGRSGHYGTVYDTPKWKVPLRYLRKIYRIIQWYSVKRKFIEKTKNDDYTK